MKAYLSFMLIVVIAPTAIAIVGGVLFGLRPRTMTIIAACIGAAVAILLWPK